MLLITIEKKTFRKGYCEIDRVLESYQNLHQWGFCQDSQMATSSNDCLMAAF